MSFYMTTAEDLYSSPLCCHHPHFPHGFSSAVSLILYSHISSNRRPLNNRTQIYKSVFSAKPRRASSFISSVMSSLSLSLSPELHPVHPAVHLRPADVDGEPVHFRLRLLQRGDHRQVVQTVRPAEGAGAGGGSTKHTRGLRRVAARQP